MKYGVLRKLVVGLVLGWCGGACMADITILGWPGGPEEKALNALVEKYNETQGRIDHNRVKTMYFGRDVFFDRLSHELTTGSRSFDVNLLATYNVGRYAAYMDPLPADMVAALNKTYPPAVLRTQQYEGRQYGIPTDMGLHFLYFRKDLQQQLLTDSQWRKTYADISRRYMGKAMVPKDPQQWDWDDFTACALFFTRSINPSSPVAYGTALQMKNILFNMMLWQNTAHSLGGDWRHGTQVSVNSDAYRKGLQIYRFITDNHATPPDSLNYEYPQANAAFAASEVAFLLQWNAAFDTLNDASTSKVAGRFDVAPPPRGSVSRGTYVHTLGFGINKASANKVDAIRFLTWMGAPDSMRFYIEKGGHTPLKTEYMRGVTKPDLLKMAEYAGWYGFLMNGGTSANALKVYEVQAAEFTAYWAGKQSAEQALTKVQAAMEDLLK